MIFAVFVSILLNLICIFCIILLYIRQSRFVELEKTQKETIEETESMLEAFLDEWKEDQELLLATLSQKKQHLIKENKEQLTEPPAQTIPVTKPWKTVQGKESSALDEQVILLHRQGLDIQEIAQKMNKGITEIELALKFYQKSNN